MADVMTRATCTTDDADGLGAEIEAVIARSRFAPLTHRTVDQVLQRFTAWCAGRGAASLPADPATVGAYLAWMAAGETHPDGELVREPYALSTIRSAKTAIGLAHDIAGLPSPAADSWLCLVMAGIARSPQLRRPRQMSPLCVDEMRALMRLPAPPPTLSAMRDRALLLVAADARWPMGEVIGLRRADVRFTGNDVILRRGDTTPTVLTPYAARAMRELQDALPRQVALAFGVRGFDHAPTFITDTSADEIAALTTSVRQSLHKCAGLKVIVREPIAQTSRTDLQRLILTRDKRKVRWLRDRAILLVGWHLGLRGSEIGTLQLSDVRRDDAGYTAWLTRTKNDQLGIGTPLSLLPTRDPLLDPVRALDAWIAYRAAAGDGALFCRIDGAQCRPHRGVTAGDDVLDIVKSWANGAGLVGRYGAHSLRIGFVVTALRNGATIAEIMTVTRQRSPEMVGYYGRAEQAARRHAPHALIARSRRASA